MFMEKALIWKDLQVLLCNNQKCFNYDDQSSEM